MKLQVISFQKMNLTGETTHYLSIYLYCITSSRRLHKDKDKDKEALFNVAYNVTDNISSRAILRHNNYILLHAGVCASVRC